MGPTLRHREALAKLGEVAERGIQAPPPCLSMGFVCSATFGYEHAIRLEKPFCPTVGGRLFLAPKASKCLLRSARVINNICPLVIETFGTGMLMHTGYGPKSNAWQTCLFAVYGLPYG